MVGSTAAMTFVVARMGLRLPLNALAGILVASAIMGAALRLVAAPIGAFALATQICVGVVIYAAAILVLFLRRGESHGGGSPSPPSDSGSTHRAAGLAAPAFS